MLPTRCGESPPPSGDAREAKPRGKQEVDLIITSPPYLGAQKYIRSSSLSLGWLEMSPSSGLKALEAKCLGREHFRKSEYREFQPSGLKAADRILRRVFKINPLRACLATTYLREMEAALAHACLQLRPGGHIVLVCSSNTICGEEFKTHEYLRQLLQSLGLSERLRLVDEIRSRGLMTRRNKTASVITSEWVYVFQKGTA